MSKFYFIYSMLFFLLLLFIISFFFFIHLFLVQMKLFRLAHIAPTTD